MNTVTPVTREMVAFVVNGAGRCRKHDCWLHRDVIVGRHDEDVHIIFTCKSTIATDCDRLNWEITMEAHGR